MSKHNGFAPINSVPLAPRMIDKGIWKPLWTIDKFIDHRDRVAKASRDGVPMIELLKQFPDYHYDLLRFNGNLLLNGGINTAWNLICGNGGTAFSNANAYIGVGDSSTAEAATQTGIQASTNRLNKAMDATYPTSGSSQLATWRSTFGSSDANFAWNEITVSNANNFTSALNRKVQTMGTKASGTSWIPTLQITLA